MHVRPIKESDYDAWLEMFNKYLIFYKSSLPEDVKNYTFKRFFDPNVEMWSAVAVNDDGKAIGFANYLRQLNTWSKNDKIYLNDLFVDETSRLKGVGRALIEFVYSDADKMGVPDVYWCTQTCNHRAQLLYTKVGKNSGMIIYKR